MPYIADHERRKELDQIVELMYGLGIQDNGEINYVLYAFAVRHVDKRYNSLKDYISELTECADEVRRRLLVPREEEAILENGDVV